MEMYQKSKVFLNKFSIERVNLLARNLFEIIELGCLAIYVRYI
jgi:hypothetical protein